MLFVIYEFTHRGRSIIVESVYSIWQQIMLVYAVELDFSIALWTVLGCSVLAESDIAVKRQLSWRASFETDHSPFKQKTRKTKYTSGRRAERNANRALRPLLWRQGTASFYMAHWCQTYWTELIWDLWKILSLDWSPQSQRCFQIQILTSTKRPADPVGWVKRMYSIHRSCQ